MGFIPTSPVSHGRNLVGRISDLHLTRGGAEAEEEEET